MWGGGICRAMRDDGARPVTERSDDSGFGPSAESLSCCLRIAARPNKKVTKEEGHPDIRVCPLRGQTSLAPALLRGPELGAPHRWAIPGPTMPCAAVLAAYPLRNTFVRPPVGGIGTE